MRKINPAQICLMRIYKKKEHNYIRWREAFKLFGITFSSEGFYYEFVSSEYMTEEEIISRGCYIEDKKVYYEPHIDIIMANDRTHTVNFNSISELEDFLNSEELASVKWVEVD